jgi:hypothetical protein
MRLRYIKRDGTGGANSRRHRTLEVGPDQAAPVGPNGTVIATPVRFDEIGCRGGNVRDDHQEGLPGTWIFVEGNAA